MKIYPEDMQIIIFPDLVGKFINEPNYKSDDITFLADGRDVYIELEEGEVKDLSLYGDKNGSIYVSGGKGDVYRCGNGNGSAIKSASDYGDALRLDDGDGNAIRTGKGEGSAEKYGRGNGNAIRSGEGKGYARHNGEGGGDAIRSGKGTGGAERYNDKRSKHIVSKYKAIRSGSGDGNAKNENGKAIRSGTGTGKIKMPQYYMV